MMQARYMLENPGKADATMKITMTVDEWEALRDQLSEKWPSWKFSGMITALLTDARRVIYAGEKEVAQ